MFVGVDNDRIFVPVLVANVGDSVVVVGAGSIIVDFIDSLFVVVVVCFPCHSSCW